jgi:hypothetical protein
METDKRKETPEAAAAKKFYDLVKEKFPIPPNVDEVNYRFNIPSETDIPQTWRLTHYGNSNVLRNFITVSNREYIDQEMAGVRATQYEIRLGHFSPLVRSGARRFSFEPDDPNKDLVETFTKLFDYLIPKETVK